MARNNYFQFQQFTVFQEKAAMKVGTDGVLLGAWADVSGCRRVLDVGTGTGLIALMIAQRSDAVVDAVEVDKGAFEDACYNVKQSSWAERITVYHDYFQEYLSKTTESYDLIVSNPPFFENALKAPDISRSTARHTDQLSFETLLTGSKNLLQPGGCLAVILPTERGDQFMQLGQKVGFFIRRVTSVYSKPGKAIHRMLIELALKPVEVIAEELIIESGNGAYSPQYKKLTAEFYLKG